MALVVKNPPANAGDMRDVGLIPGSGRSSGGGHGNPLQYSCLENPMVRATWWATVHVVAKSQTWLSDFHFHLHLHMEKSTFKFFSLFFFNWITGILLYKVVSGILDNKTLSHIWFKNGLSHSVGCLFTLLIVSFDAQNILIFMESNLSILSCVASAFSPRHQDMTCLPTHSALFLPLLFLPPLHSPLETLASPCPSSTQGPLPP